VDAQKACERIFAQIPKDDLSRYFDHVMRVEDDYWKQEGFAPKHPEVIIPVFDDDDEDDEAEDDTAYMDDLILEPVSIVAVRSNCTSPRRVEFTMSSLSFPMCEK
jgi:hypothetical protein